MEIKDIRVFLKRYIDQDVVYVANPGNAGDSLIAYGTLLVFEEMGLKYTIGDWNKHYKGKTLFYAGGGNLVGLYRNCSTFLKNNKDNNDIVVLPHTIKSEDKLLSSLGPNVILMCREKKSYRYVKDIVKHKQNVFLSKDMAFYISHLDSFKEKKGKDICHAYRTDVEKTNVAIPRDNIDISVRFNRRGNTQHKSVIKSVSLSIFEYLSKYEVIFTNRLHVAIAAYLIGKKVEFYGNSYWKNKAVYEYSLSQEKNVVFNA